MSETTQIELGIILYAEKKYEIDLNDMNFKTIKQLNVGMNDVSAHAMLFSFFRGEEEVDIEGTNIAVVMKVRLADGTQATINGQMEQDAASEKYYMKITFSSSFYAVEGVYKATVYATSGSQRKTIMNIEGSVIKGGN